MKHMQGIYSALMGSTTVLLTLDKVTSSSSVFLTNIKGEEFDLSVAKRASYLDEPFYSIYFSSLYLADGGC